MFVVGLTGGIGSGKSTVAERFAARGVPVIDTDAIARELAAPGGAALPDIHARFGDAVMQADGTLDRAALRRIVFADGAARRQLEAILHPRIRRRVEQTVAALTAPYALIVIPLLVQRQDCLPGECSAASPVWAVTADYRPLLNRVLVVDCPEVLQIERVMARNGLSQADVEAILATQAGRAERLAAADDVIVNVDTPAALDAEVAHLHRRYLALAAGVMP
jgi:dephospho-CoA kinase